MLGANPPTRDAYPTYTQGFASNISILKVEGAMDVKRLKLSKKKLIVAKNATNGLQNNILECVYNGVDPQAAMAAWLFKISNL